MHPEIKKTEKNMKIQQIRNATIKIEYAGKVMLIDPMLGEKGYMPPFPFSHHQELRNPIHDLPMTVDELLRDVDCVLLTHLHTDHIDDAAYEQLPKEMLIVVQDELDREVVVSHGFKQVKVIEGEMQLGDVRLSKAESHHGHWWMLPKAGHTCGYVFQHPAEPTTYLAGDTIWYSGVRRNLDRWQPDVVIVNAGGNKFHVGGHVIMHIPDVLKTMDYAPKATFVATHLEGVNHNHVTRAALLQAAREHGVAGRVHIPEDGESVNVSK